MITLLPQEPSLPPCRPALQILLVEDNSADVRLTEEAFKEGHVNTWLQVARDGEEALAILRRQAPFTDAARPDIVLLDLNLPRKDGFEVLAEIKNDEELRHTPVVVLTTSNVLEDVQRTYDLHANCYIRKPVDFEDFLRVVRQIDEFWLSLVELPLRA